MSNRSDTWYFANNNANHFSFDADERFLPLYQFAEPNNKKITRLDEFARVFLAKCTLGEMISRYMVLVASEQKLLMMRPYQIYAVQAIVECIRQNRGNGYIWHTTGSGKTLTSFKTSTLLKDNPDIDKCLFVVDRKDLDQSSPVLRVLAPFDETELYEAVDRAREGRGVELERIGELSDARVVAASDLEEKMALRGRDAAAFGLTLERKFDLPLKGPDAFPECADDQLSRKHPVFLVDFQHRRRLRVLHRRSPSPSYPLPLQ